MIVRHGLNYTPLLPHPKIVRVRGLINETSLVVLWLWWGVDIILWRGVR